MAIIYGMQQLEHMILKETNANARKGLLGEKDILLMLQKQLPSHAYVIHNPTLIQYEADILVIEENIGFMFLEVKTWNERFIERFYPNGSISTQCGQQKPLKQAENYRGELKSTLSTHLNHSITQDLHQLISSIVVFNGISKEQFLHRAEVRDWEEEWKNKFLAKHYFYAGESSGFYSWMRRSKKFNRSRLSDCFSGESLDQLIEVLFQDNEITFSPVENKLPMAVQREQKMTAFTVDSLVQENKPKKVKVSPFPEVKRKNKSGILIAMSAIAIASLIFILNDWGYDEDSYEWQEDRTSDNLILLESSDDETTVDPEEAFNYFILADSQYSKLVESQLYGFSKSDLRIARNEIYARHGYIFESEDLQRYFTSQKWYIPDALYNYELTDIEQYNVTLIQSME